jgi:tetratricopeptide (TPR) repeat protein
VEASVPVCTRAVEVAVTPAAVLDSRAMAYLRVGDFDRALRDANAALAAQPGQHETLLLRGMIRLASGDEGGDDDVRNALARAPALESEYARYGLTRGR